MSISEHKHMSKDEVVRARRIEVFSGAGRRRSWSPEDKAAIVAESFATTFGVSRVARQHGLTPSQLFTWRREARRQNTDARGPAFVPVMVDEAAAGSRLHDIELDVDGANVWIWRGADAGMVTTIICALKAAK
jgi:transposase